MVFVPLIGIGSRPSWAQGLPLNDGNQGRVRPGSVSSGSSERPGRALSYTAIVSRQPCQSAQTQVPVKGPAYR